MLIYVSGPMTNVGPPTFNYPAFNEAAARLRELGYDVLNPAETAGGATHLPRETYMKVDISYVMAADAVALLPGWADSDGAKLEVLIARATGKAIFRFDYNEGLGVPLQVEDVTVTVTPVGYGAFLSKALRAYVDDRDVRATRYGGDND